jgi:hypothetical protein
MISARRAPALVASLTGLACQCLVACHGPATSESANLGGSAARVGAAPISVALVSRISASAAPPTEAGAALRLAEEDALGEQKGRALGCERSAQAAWEITTLLARRTLARVRAGAEAEGPVRDDELADVIVIHALVQRSPKLGDAEGASLAGTIRDAVLAARDEQDFAARANAVPHGRLPLVVERLAAFDASGRTQDGAWMTPSFVAAAFELRAAGDTSPVVATEFGWHVIRLLARNAPAPEALESRRAALTSFSMDRRERAAVAGLLRERGLRTAVGVNPDADRLMTAAAARMP